MIHDDTSAIHFIHFVANPIFTSDAVDIDLIASERTCRDSPAIQCRNTIWHSRLESGQPGLRRSYDPVCSSLILIFLYHTSSPWSWRPMRPSGATSAQSGLSLGNLLLATNSFHSGVQRWYSNTTSPFW